MTTVNEEVVEEVKVEEPAKDAELPEAGLPMLSPKELQQLKVEELKNIRKQFFSQLKTSKNSLDALLHSATQIKIMGKTLDEWKQFFHVKIPPNPALDDVYACLAKTNSLIAYVNHQLGVAELARDTVKREVNDTHAKRFIRLKAKKPGARALSNEHVNFQIESELTDEYNQLMFSEYTVSFWDNRRQQLISTRKILESILYGIGGEMRMRQAVNHHDQTTPSEPKQDNWGSGL